MFDIQKIIDECHNARLQHRDILNKIYELDSRDDARYHRLASQEIMMFIETHISKNEFTEVNDFFKIIDVFKLSTYSICGLVRSSYRVRNYIPEWDKVYFAAWVRIADLNKDPRRIFIGLPAVNRHQK